MQYRLEGKAVPDHRARYIPPPGAVPSLELIQLAASKDMLTYVEAVNELNKHLAAARGHRDPHAAARQLNHVLASDAFKKVCERLNVISGVAMGRAVAKAKQARGLMGIGPGMITRRDVLDKHGELLARVGNRGHPDQQSLRTEIITAFNLDNVKVLPEAEKNKLWCWISAYEPQLLWWMDHATEDIDAVESGESKSQSKQLTMKVLKGLFAEAPGNIALLDDFKDLMVQIHGEDAASDMVYSCAMDEKARQHASRRPRQIKPEWLSGGASDKDWDACDVSAAGRPPSAPGSVNGDGWRAGCGSAASLPSTARVSVNENGWANDGWVRNDGWGVRSGSPDDGPPTPRSPRDGPPTPGSVKGWDTCNDFGDGRPGSPVPCNNRGTSNNVHGAKRSFAGPSTNLGKHREPRSNEGARANPSDEPTQWELPNGSRSNINHGIVWGHARNEPAHRDFGQTSKVDEKRVNKTAAEMMATRKKKMEATPKRPEMRTQQNRVYSAPRRDFDSEKAKAARLAATLGHGHGTAGQARPDSVW